MKSTLFAFFLATIGVPGFCFADPCCFPTVDAYMSKSYGASHADDENIFVKEEKYGNDVFYWVADKTSGTNYARSLLKKNASGEFCLVLSTRPAAQVVPEMVDTLGAPRQFVATEQAPPGMPEHEITYELNGTSLKYEAKTCKAISHIGKRRTVKSISCGRFLTP